MRRWVLPVVSRDLRKPPRLPGSHRIYRHQRFAGRVVIQLHKTRTILCEGTIIRRRGRRRARVVQKEKKTKRERTRTDESR